MANQDLYLGDRSKVGVIGGGPAGSFFSYFLLDMAHRTGIDVLVDVYEPRDFSRPGPGGCNMCGGIISESLVQILAAEGIVLPPTIVQRGIDAYMLHMEEGSVRIETPLQEKRIAAVHRGSGPRDIQNIRWASFDGHLQSLSIAKGATVIHKRVEKISWEAGRPALSTRGGDPQTYDLVVVATGVNSAARRLFANTDLAYEPPGTTKTFICEYFIGEQTITEYLGTSMHVFLLDMPRLEFAAIIPKGDYVSVCLLGEAIDNELVQSFLATEVVQKCFPPGWLARQVSCHCSPRINIRAAEQPFSDRVVFIGDSGVSRLFKDGIGAAYQTAKAAATTAILQGISAGHFERFFWPACRRIEMDNRVGKVIFFITRQIQRRGYARQAILSMTSAEQQLAGAKRRMSAVLWDTFTGSAPYRDIFMRTLHPGFLRGFLGSLADSVFRWLGSIIRPTTPTAGERG